MRDDDKKKYKSMQKFYSFQNVAHKIILELPWIMKANPHVNWKTLTWRYSLNTVRKRIIVDSLEKFVKTVDETNTIYALICSLTPNSDEPTKISTEIQRWKNVFSPKTATTLPFYKTHNHAINLLFEKTSPYKPLYLMFQKKLKILQEYFKNNLANGRIRHSIADVETPVLFVSKNNNELRLCVDYKKLNTITLKNKIFLPFIDETLNRLIDVKYFIKLNLKNTYHRIRIKLDDE